MIIAFHLSACSQSGRFDAGGNHTIDERYRVALSYIERSPEVMSYYRQMYLDTTVDAIFAISSAILDPNVQPFELNIVNLKYGLMDSSDNSDAFWARVHDEIALKNVRRKAFKAYEIPALRGLGVRDGANLSISFSSIYADIIPGREVLLAEVRPVYSPGQAEDLREQGIATHMYLKLMFVFKASAIDTVFSGIIT